MSVVRIAFLGTPDIARYCLEALLKDSHFKVVGVITQPDRPAGRRMKRQASPVKTLAAQHHIPVLTPLKASEPSVIDEVASWRAEAAVVVAFGQILSPPFLDLFPLRMVNVHTSLLPRWRGAAPIQRAIMAGDKKTGVSLQVMVKKLDAGDVIGQRVIDITDNMDAIELHEKMKPLAADLLHIELMDYLRGNLVPRKQDEALVTYAKKIEKSESLIDWHLSAEQIHANMRGLVLGPGVHTFINKKKIKILKAEMVVNNIKDNATDNNKTGENSCDHLLPTQLGQVIEVGESSFVVECGRGALRVFEVQPESRQQMKVKDYLRGYPLTVGEQFSDSP